ncbi:MAG TPA: hypothetical protein VNU26_16395 [Mycobacteriales bacterium]|nr:hypothetical protein [Mycobacteriales bacterium]
MPDFDDLRHSGGAAADSLQVQRAMAAGMTRRQALKRAGFVVGATAWATPVVQTVMAGSAAATPVQQPTCPTGATDTSGTACGGSYCPKCGADKLCTQNSDCLSNECVTSGNKKVCAKSTAGKSCTGNADCTTNICTGNTCRQAGAGGSCDIPSDCTTGVCGSNKKCSTSLVGGSCATSSDCAKVGSYQVVCSGTPKVCGGTGANCTQNSHCASGTCSGGFCT